MRTSNCNAHRLIRNRRDFEGSNLRGATTSAGRAAWHVGYLPRDHRDVATLTEADFVVYSYATPIAWHVPDVGWFVPEVSYSISTARHQSYVRSAVRDQYAPGQEESWRTIPTSRAAAEILRAIRSGHAVEVKGKRRATLELVVATGEARVDGGSLVPVDGSHVRVSA